MLGGVDDPAQSDQDLKIEGYSISGTGSLDSLQGTAHITLRLGAPPGSGSGHPLNAVLYEVNWKQGGTVHWAGVSVAAGGPNSPVGGPRFQAGTYDVNSSSFTTHENDGSAEWQLTGPPDPVKATGYVSPTNSTISIDVPYGEHAGPDRQPVSSSAQVYLYAESTLAANVPAPVYALPSVPPPAQSNPPDYPMLDNSTIYSVNTSPGTSTPGAEQGPGGAPFCGGSRLSSGAGICDSIPAAYENAPPVGTVTCLPQRLPNFFAQTAYGLQNNETHNVHLLVDQKHGAVIEYDFGLGCDSQPKRWPYNIIALNLDTYDAIPGGAGCIPAGTVQDPSNYRAFDAVDSADGILFFAGLRDVVAVDESTMAIVAHIGVRSPTASPEQLDVKGVSWHSADRQLIVVTEGSPPGVANDDPGVNVESIKIGPAPSYAPVPLWATAVTGCQQAMDLGAYGNGNAYLSDTRPAVFVPCELQRNGATQGAAHRDGIVRVDLSAGGGSAGEFCAAEAKICPSAFHSAFAPGESIDASSDFLFDPGSDRGYINFATGSGVTVNVYDPDQGNGVGGFAGRTAVGTARDNGYTPFAIDGATGRLYGLGPTAGLTLIDGRRTQLAPGSQLPEFGAPALHQGALIPPTPAHPFARFIVGYEIGDHDPTTCERVCRMPEFAALADRIPVTDNPNPGVIDQSTYDGPVNPGDQLFKTFTADARGYGVHSDLVGSTDYILSNNGGRQLSGNTQAGAGDRDLFAGTVSGLNLTNTSASGDAAALGRDDSTASALGNCTDAYSLKRCAVLLPEPPVDNNGNPYLGSTNQQWPYPAATCSNAEGQRDATATGLDYTSGYDSAGKPITNPVPASSGIAGAEAHCAGAGGEIKGSAELNAEALTATKASGAGSLPRVSVGKAQTSSWVRPDVSGNDPALTWIGSSIQGQGTLTHVESSAEGVVVDVPDSGNGAGRISIGHISQVAETWATGRPLASGGGAHARRTVALDSVYVTTGGSTVELCGTQDQCAAQINQVKDAINAQFPGQLSIAFPTPYEFLMKGSPGGYTAAIEANLVEQYTDQQFNGMRPNEATFLPAVRLIAYDDGSDGLNREILDFAGVQADTQLGVQDFGLPSLEVKDAIGGTVSQFDVPGTPGSAGTPGQPGVTGGYTLIHHLLSAFTTHGRPGDISSGAPGVKVVEELLRRLAIGWRSLGQMLQVFAIVIVLAMPLILMARRQLWLDQRNSD
jgi:hypothetical protein